MDAEVCGDLGEGDARSAGAGDAHDIVTELLRLGLGHGDHPLRPTGAISQARRHPSRSGRVRNWAGVAYFAALVCPDFLVMTRLVEMREGPLALSPPVREVAGRGVDGLVPVERRRVGVVGDVLDDPHADAELLAGPHDGVALHVDD